MGSEMQQVRATATYNFVPLADNVMLQKSLEEHTYGKSVHGLDRNKNTGEIHLTYTAKTPIYISNGQNEFITDAKGKEIIPGTTIRGMVRSNMQILGEGKLGADIQDGRMYFRKMVGNREDANTIVRAYYKDTLGVEGKNLKNVEPGYIVREEGEYKIYKTDVQCKSQAHEHLQADRETTFEIKVVWYLGKEFDFKERKGWNKGVMLFTGNAPNKKPNSRYLFQEFTRGKVINLRSEDITYYEEDYNMRIGVKKDAKAEKLWKLPEEGEIKPVFYLQDGSDTYFGMSRFLRISHKFPVTAGVPEQHKSEEITFVEGILGYSYDKNSMCSRVQFGDAKVKEKINHDKFDVILGEPKPSFYAAYLKGHLDKGRIKAAHYSLPNFEIRGYKRYWMKDLKKPNQNTIKKNVATTLSPLNTGSVFQGAIRYKNLSDEELGLLLWAFQLDDGCYQTIGMGKSLGMGRVKVKIEKLRQANLNYTYEDFSNPFKEEENSEKCINDYINKYKELIKENRAIDEFLYISKKIVGEEVKAELEDIKDLKFDAAKVATVLEDISEIKEVWENPNSARKTMNNSHDARNNRGEQKDKYRGNGNRNNTKYTGRQ